VRWVAVAAADTVQALHHGAAGARPQSPEVGGGIRPTASLVIPRVQRDLYAEFRVYRIDHLVDLLVSERRLAVGSLVEWISQNVTLIPSFELHEDILQVVD